MLSSSRSAMVLKFLVAHVEDFPASVDIVNVSKEVCGGKKVWRAATRLDIDTRRQLARLWR